MVIKRVFLPLLLATIAILALCTSAFAAEENVSKSTLRVAVFADHYAKLKQVYESKGCVSTDQFNVGENQMLAEFLLFCYALESSGEYQIQLVPFPVIDRVLDALKKSEVDAIAFGIWASDAERYGFDMSQPLLESGQFTKGLYTRADLAQKYQGIPVSELQELIIVANQNWKEDWKALTCAGMSLLHVNRYEQMFRLVEKGRADFLPLTFSAKQDLERKVFNISLYPLKGIKIQFSQSLHFVVNPQQAKAKALQDALNQGLKRQRQSGQIQRVCERLGLINPKVTNWLAIGC